MWKEKLYTGTISSSTTTVSIKKYPDTTTVSVNAQKTDALNECILDFLKNVCGVQNVVYYPATGSDDKKGNIFINGCPFQFYVSGSNTYWTASCSA